MSKKDEKIVRGLAGMAFVAGVIASVSLWLALFAESEYTAQNHLYSGFAFLAISVTIGFAMMWYVVPLLIKKA